MGGAALAQSCRASVSVANRLRIVSANLLNGYAIPEAFVALVQQLEADIINVQEIAPNQAAALAAVMPFGRLRPAYDCTGIGIAARRPVAMREIRFPGSQACVADVRPEDWPGLRSPLEIINVHFAAPHHLPVWRPLRKRRAQLRALDDYCDGAAARARIVIGDFNATPLWPLYRRLATRFTDAAREVARRQRTVPHRTWGPWRDAPKLLRVDHAFVSGVGIEDFRTVPVRGSDHSAIVVDAAIA